MKQRSSVTITTRGLVGLFRGNLLIGMVIVGGFEAVCCIRPSIGNYGYAYVLPVRFCRRASTTVTTDPARNKIDIQLENRKKGSPPVAENACLALFSRLAPKTKAITKGKGDMSTLRIKYPKMPKPKVNQSDSVLGS